jgi:2-C-methyl-D-erythritol 4-phosphate cytidylyltransferase
MTFGGMIVAAGSGTRMGGVDKCALPLNGRSMVSYSVAVLAGAVTDLVVVVAAAQLSAWRTIADTEGWSARVRFVSGGETRGQSVFAGLSTLEDGGACAYVAVHDGARPLLSLQMVDDCFAAAREHGAVTLATPVTDTIKRVDGTRIVETPDRAGLWAAQTPQVFAWDVLRAAFAWARTVPPLAFTDEAGLVEAFGHPVHVVRGSRENFKVTEPVDYRLAEIALAARRSANA